MSSLDAAPISCPGPDFAAAASKRKYDHSTAVEAEERKAKVAKFTDLPDDEPDRDLFDDPKANEPITLQTPGGPVHYTKRLLIQHSNVLRAVLEGDPSTTEVAVLDYSKAVVQSLLRALETRASAKDYKAAKIFQPDTMQAILLTFKLAHQWDISLGLDYVGQVIVSQATIPIDALGLLRAAHSRYYDEALNKFIVSIKQSGLVAPFERCHEQKTDSEPILADAIYAMQRALAASTKQLAFVKAAARAVIADRKKYSSSLSTEEKALQIALDRATA